MATISRSLSTKADGNGLNQILLRINISRTLQIRTKSNIFISSNRYKDGTIQLPRMAGVERNDIIEKQALLSKLESRIIKICEITPDEVLSKQWIEEVLPLCEKIETSDITQSFIEVELDKKQHPEKYTVAEKRNFFELMESFLQKRKLSEVRETNFRVLIRALMRYELFVQQTADRAFHLDLNTLNKGIIEDIESFLRNEYTLYEEYPEIYKRIPAIINPRRKTTKPQPRGNNTICALFNKLRAFINWCIKEGEIKKNPFIGYDGTTTEKYGTPFFLTLDERNQIADFDLSVHPQLAIQRDIFIFQCLVGCRVSDLLQMKDTTIVTGAIEYIPHKTKDKDPVTVRVPLNARAEELVAKYKGVDTQNRLFPFISAQKYNDDIKDILRICGITRSVTILNPTNGKEEKRPINEVASSHMARRTFIGNLYKKVKDPNLVGALSGHKEGSKAFSRYRDIDDDMKKELVNLLEKEEEDKL